MNVLIIDDDKHLSLALKNTLKKENCSCEIAHSGVEGLEYLRVGEYDLVVLDLYLPDMHGSNVLKDIRNVKSFVRGTEKFKVPILFISAEGEIDEKVNILRQGADDYLVKPFNSQEFIARCHAIVRRSRGFESSNIEIGELVVNIQMSVAMINGRRLKLTNKEYMVLEFLSLRKDMIVTKEALISHLYGGMDEPEMKIIDVFVCNVRKKIRTMLGHDHSYIDTIWGRGYILQDPQSKDEVLEASASTSEENTDQQTKASLNEEEDAVKRASSASA